MHTYINASEEVFATFISKNISGPFQMLNLLKFKEQVEGSGLSGKAQYQKYMEAATPFIKTSGAKLTFIGNTMHCLIGPTEREWDKILLVEYPSKEAFLKMVLDKEYPSHLRTLALADSRLILCQ